MNLELLKVESRKSPIRGNILFIHGVYHAAWCWENFLPYFAKRGFNAYALSLRGHGTSEGKVEIAKATFSDYLGDVSTTIARFKTPPILVGHSLGGMLIRKYIEQNYVPAAVLISAPTPKAMRWAGPILFRRWPLKILRFIITQNPEHLHKDPEVLKTLYFSENFSDEQLKQILQRLLNQNESHRIFRELSFMNFNKPKVHVPVLVLGSGKDFTLKPSTFFETATMYGTEPIIFKNKPHDMMLEDGWEEIADCIIRWLKINLTFQLTTNTNNMKKE